MKHFFTLVLVFCVYFSAAAQKRATEYNIEDIDESTEIIRKFWAANRAPSYLSVLPFIKSIGERRLSMREGEGRGDNQLLEAHINLSFPLAFGKREDTKLLALEYTGNFRMTLDSSKPLTPGSHKIGLSYYHILDKKIHPDKPGQMRFTTLRVQAKHYSNGQAPGFFYTDPTDNTNVRNSYLDGDFSTNFLAFWLTRGIFNKDPGSIHQFTLGYRWDLGTEESTFAFTEEQEHAYGRHRLTGIYDYKTKRSLTKKFDHRFRLATRYIVGNLNQFRPNLVNNSKKYRMNFKGTYELAPKRYYAVGYFVSVYWGRDYLNIRYDDIIYSIQFGITLSTEKLFM